MGPSDTLVEEDEGDEGDEVKGSPSGALDSDHEDEGGGQAADEITSRVKDAEIVICSVGGSCLMLSESFFFFLVLFDFFF